MTFEDYQNELKILTALVNYLDDSVMDKLREEYKEIKKHENGQTAIEHQSGVDSRAAGIVCALPVLTPNNAALGAFF